MPPSLLTLPFSKKNQMLQSDKNIGYYRTAQIMARGSYAPRETILCGPRTLTEISTLLLTDIE